MMMMVMATVGRVARIVGIARTVDTPPVPPTLYCASSPLECVHLVVCRECADGAVLRDVGLVCHAFNKLVLRAQVYHRECMIVAVHDSA
jgi:hypothetical protein